MIKVVIMKRNLKSVLVYIGYIVLSMIWSHQHLLIKEKITYLTQIINQSKASASILMMMILIMIMMILKKIMMIMKMMIMMRFIYINQRKMMQKRKLSKIFWKIDLIKINIHWKSKRLKHFLMTESAEPISS